MAIPTADTDLNPDRPAARTDLMVTRSPARPRRHPARREPRRQRGRTTIRIALRLSDTEPQCDLPTSEILNPFDENTRRRLLTESDERRQENAGNLIGRQQLGDRTIELDDVRLQHHETVETGVSRSGIVDRDPRTAGAQPIQTARQTIGVDVGCVLGQLDHNALPVDGGYEVGQRVRACHQRRHVDGKIALIRQGLEGGEGTPDGQELEGFTQPHTIGVGEPRVGSSLSSVGKPCQGLEPDRCTGRKVDDRLIHDRQVIPPVEDATDPFLHVLDLEIGLPVQDDPAAELGTKRCVVTSQALVQHARLELVGAAQDQVEAIDRLGQVVRRSCAECPFPRRGRHVPGHDDDRDEVVGRQVTEPAEQLEPVDLRHTEIEQYQVGTLLDEDRDHLRRVGHPDDLTEPSRLQEFAHQFDVARNVIDDHDASRIQTVVETVLNPRQLRAWLLGAHHAKTVASSPKRRKGLRLPAREDRRQECS